MDTLCSRQATPDSLASNVRKTYHQKWFQSQSNLLSGIYVRHLNSRSMWLAKFWSWKGHQTGPINRKGLREKSAETNHYYGHCIRVAGLGRWLACLDVLCFYPSVIKQGQKAKTPSNLLVPLRPKIPDNSSGMITAAGWDQETFQPRALRENVKPSTQTTGAGAERRKFSSFQEDVKNCKVTGCRTVIETVKTNLVLRQLLFTTQQTAVPNLWSIFHVTYKSVMC